MIKNKSPAERLPLIGFFPAFYSIGEVIPQIKIAKIYREQGGNIIFFSHGGKYEHLAQEAGFKVVTLTHLWEGFIAKGTQMLEHDVPFEKIIIGVYRKEIIDTFVKEEIEALKKFNVKMIFSSFNPTLCISARACNIPLVVLISGTSIPPFYQSPYITFPENYENNVTRFIPNLIKNHIARWYLLHNKILTKVFNDTAKRYNIQPFRYLNDIFLGDHTLVCDDIRFLGISPTKEFPAENFVGPIAGDLYEEHPDTIDDDIKHHLKKPGKSILLIMGSIGQKQLFLNILNCLNNTNYNVIAVYTTILKPEEIPTLHQNILLKQFVSSPLTLHHMVDLSIIHGGRGTVYTAAYSGKPSIGIPMQLEHQYNIDCLVRHGAGLRVSKKFFTEKKLLSTITTIFNNYETFLHNAQQLASTLTREPGEEKAAQRLIELTQHIQQ